MAKRLIVYDTVTGTKVHADPATSLAATPPTTTTLVTAGGALGRWVHGVITLTPAVAVAASILVEVETGVASGAYTAISTAATPALATPAAVTQWYSFFVPTGRRYRFTMSGGVGVTETITKYNYTEI